MTNFAATDLASTEATDKKSRRFGMSLAAFAMLALTGCASDGPPEVANAEEDDKFTDNFGISSLARSLNSAPDEFSVLTKKPLEIPDRFDDLPVPQPGKISTRDPSPALDARTALQLGTAPSPAIAASATAAPSATEAAILSGTTADPNIRAIVASEQQEYNDGQELYVLDRIFPNLRELRGDASVNDLDAEAERLRLLETGVIERRGLTTVDPADLIEDAPAPLSPESANAPLVPVPGIRPFRSATVPAPVPAAPRYTPIDAGPVLAAPQPVQPAPAPAAPSGTPTFGVLDAVPATPAEAPELIYIPE